MAEFDNVISYSLQLAVLAAAGLVMPFFLRLHAPRTVHEFVVLRLHVHHQVAVHIAEARHGAGGDHVEHHLRGRAGLEARGSGDDFRTDDGDDSDVHLRHELLRHRRAGDDRGSRAPLTCSLDGAVNEGSRA